MIIIIIIIITVIIIISVIINSFWEAKHPAQQGLVASRE